MWRPHFWQSLARRVQALLSSWATFSSSTFGPVYLPFRDCFRRPSFTFVYRPYSYSYCTVLCNSMYSTTFLKSHNQSHKFAILSPSRSHKSNTVKYQFRTQPVFPSNQSKLSDANFIRGLIARTVLYYFLSWLTHIYIFYMYVLYMHKHPWFRYSSFCRSFPHLRWSLSPIAISSFSKLYTCIFQILLKFLNFHIWKKTL